MLQSVDWLRVLGALTGLRVCVNAEIVGCVNQICPQWHGMGPILGPMWRAGIGPAVANRAFCATRLSSPPSTSSEKKSTCRTPVAA